MDISKYKYGNLSAQELETIASMHISSTIADKNLKEPCRKYRFYLDKVLLFYEFDKESIIVAQTQNGEIAGILIYTWNEKEFNDFAGPLHFRFYIRLLKAFSGYYGFDFCKYLIAALSMTGKSRRKTDTPEPKSYGKIWVLLVMEEFRRMGIAKALVTEAKKIMKKKSKDTSLIVTVKTDNKPAIKTYESCGFKIYGTCEESSGHSYIMKSECSS